MTSPARADASAPSRSTDFASDLRQAMLGARAALTELIAAIDGDASRPQDLSRRFGINRNMAWKLSRLIRADDPVPLIGHLPGTSGLRILLDTCARHGASSAACTAVREAVDGLDTVVRRHAGDRAGLDMLLTSMATGDDAVDVQEPARRQAFVGNASIWGVQARLQFGLHVQRPSADDPDAIDATAVTGLLGFQRLRPTARWPLMRLQGLTRDADGRLHSTKVHPLAADAAPDAPPLLPAFSSLPPSRLARVERDDAVLWELREGAVGRTGLVDCVFGRRAPNLASQYADHEGDAGWITLPLFTPVEAMQLDVLVHRDLSFADAVPSVHLLSRLEGHEEAPLSDDTRHELPVAGRRLDLGSPPAMSSPASVRHAELTAWVLDHLGARAEEFRAWRLVLSYPPIPSTPALRFPYPLRS